MSFQSEVMERARDWQRQRADDGWAHLVRDGETVAACGARRPRWGVGRPRCPLCEALDAVYGPFSTEAREPGEHA